MHNDSDSVEEDGDEDASDLSVHDHNLPEVVVQLVSIVEEAKFLSDIHSMQPVLIFPHQDEDSHWNAESPDHETW